MIGIGHKQEKATKIKILAERAQQYNRKYDELIAQGLDPQEVASRLQKEEYETRHQGLFVDEPYKVTPSPCRPPPASTKLAVPSISATQKRTRPSPKRRPSMHPSARSSRHSARERRPASPLPRLHRNCWNSSA